MSVWALASLGFIPPIFAALAVCAHGQVGRRFIAAQMAGTLTILTLVALTYVYDQPSSIDLPLMLAFLSLPAALLFSLFVQRWL